jgi:lipopolysaccharide export system permease protein
MTELSLSELFNPSARDAQDAGKWRVEGNKRLAGPFAAPSYALVALLSVLTGAFRRYGGVLRPLAAIGAVVGLLAIGLAVGNIAVRNTALMPLIWVHAILPGVVCGWLLFGPGLLADRRRGSGMSPGGESNAGSVPT